MNVSPLVAGSKVGRLRVRVAERDVSRAGRCATILRPLDLEPAGMSPHAILCVRAVPDPMPGGIALHSRVERPPLAWEAAARAALKNAWQRAARPAHEPVSATADAVWFADRGELLACAARDAARGDGIAAWWWEHLLPDRTVAAVAALWRREPTFIPAALERLIAIDRPAAVAFLQRLPRAHAVPLLDAVCRAFAAPALATSLIDAIERPERVTRAPGSPPASAPDGRATPPPPQSNVPGRARPVPPWRALISRDVDVESLPIASALVAAVALSLRAAPHVVRSERFREAAVAAALSLGAAASATVAHGAVSAVEVPRGPQNPAPPLKPAAETSPPLAQPSALTRPHSSPGGTRAVENRGAQPDTVQPPASPVPIQARHRPEPRPQAPSPMAPAHVEIDRAPGPPPVAPPLATAPVAPDAEVAILSEFGGLLFVLNALDNLELYSIGLAEREDLEISVWEFLRRTGMAWAGDAFERDALHGFLAHLVEEEAPATATALDLEPVLARVRDHVRSVMDLDRAELLLVQQPARIVHSATHVDGHFALERHPIAIRVARLDRNPGWIPGAGRYVSFHFTCRS